MDEFNFAEKGGEKKVGRGPQRACGNVSLSRDTLISALSSVLVPS